MDHTGIRRLNQCIRVIFGAYSKRWMEWSGEDMETITEMETKGEWHILKG